MTANERHIGPESYLRRAAANTPPRRPPCREHPDVALAIMATARIPFVIASTAMSTPSHGLVSARRQAASPARTNGARVSGRPSFAATATNARSDTRASAPARRQRSTRFSRPRTDRTSRMNQPTSEPHAQSATTTKRARKTNVRRPNHGRVHPPADQPEPSGWHPATTTGHPIRWRVPPYLLTRRVVLVNMPPARIRAEFALRFTAVGFGLSVANTKEVGAVPND